MVDALRDVASFIAPVIMLPWYSSEMPWRIIKRHFLRKVISLNVKPIEQQGLVQSKEYSGFSIFFCALILETEAATRRNKTIFFIALEYLFNIRG